jgi:hypothetical protein
MGFPASQPAMDSDVPSGIPLQRQYATLSKWNLKALRYDGIKSCELLSRVLRGVEHHPVVDRRESLAGTGGKNLEAPRRVRVVRPELFN